MTSPNELLESLQALLPHLMVRHPDSGSRCCLACGSVSDPDECYPQEHYERCPVPAANAAVAKAVERV